MDIEVRRGLGELGPEWDRLVEARPVPSPFLRSWWVDHAAAGEPVTVVCRDRDRVVGGVALQASRRAGVEWLEMAGDGALEPDHLDLVAEPEVVAGVRQAIAGWLGRAGNRVLDLRGLVPDGDLVACCPGVGSVRPITVAPYVPLPASFEEFMAARPGKLRSTVSRRGKAFDKAGITTRVRRADEVDEALTALAALHDDRWGEASGFMAAWDRFAAAARAGAAAGEVAFTELVDADGDVVATEVDLWTAGRVSFYQAGRRTTHELRGSGSVLRARIIARAIEDGMAEFDLLRGDEPYKTEWASAERGLARVRKGIGPRGIAVVAAAEANLAIQRGRGAVESWWARRRESRREERAG